MDAPDQTTAYDQITIPRIKGKRRETRRLLGRGIREAAGSVPGRDTGGRGRLPVAAGTAACAAIASEFASRLSGHVETRCTPGDGDTPSSYWPNATCAVCAGRGQGASTATRWRRPSACTTCRQACCGGQRRRSRPRTEPRPCSGQGELGLGSPAILRPGLRAQFALAIAVRRRGAEAGAGHHDFPTLLAEALDVLAALDADPKRAAAVLDCTPSQLIRLLKLDPRALALVNGWRRSARCTLFSREGLPLADRGVTKAAGSVPGRAAHVGVRLPVAAGAGRKPSRERISENCSARGIK